MHFLLNLCFAGAQVTRLDTQAKRHVFKHRHVAKQRVMLKHKTHLSIAHMHMRGVFAAEQNRAAVCRLQARNDAQQRGLAATRGAEQGDQLA